VKFDVTPKIRNRLMLILVLGIPTAIFICSIFYNAFHLTPPPPMPNPNGYDDLMKASKMLTSDVDNYTNHDVRELQTIVSAESNALQLARTGLQKQCRVPLDYNPTGTANLDKIVALKRLGAGFAAEGDLAEMQGHPDEAAKSYLDIIHVANESSRGGVLIDEIMGIANEHRGTEKLQQLTPRLNANTCRETASALETLDAQRQAWEDVLWQEHYWSRRAFPGIGAEIGRFASYREIQKVDQDVDQKYEEQQTRTRKLIIDLAARAYELDKGHPPAAVSDLVTNYLKTIPIDPVTGTNMVYLPK
jgi:hypothetical protein